MIRLRKWLLVSLAAVPLLLLTAFVAYDLLAFQPYRSNISALIEGAAPEDRMPPAPAAALLRISLQGHTSPYAARLLLVNLHLVPTRTLAWQRTWALWSILVCLHLTENERTAVIASLAPTGPGRKGLSATARSLYGRALSELSLGEQASVVVATEFGASYSYVGSHTLATQRDALLAKYAAGS